MRFTETRKKFKTHFAKDPCVVKYNGKYYLYYSVFESDIPNRLCLGIASSDDMENWEIVGEILPETKVESKGIGAAGAIVLNGKIHLFYQTYGNWEKDAICHAVSTDGIHFERDRTNPVFSPTKDWCCGRAIDADAVEFNGRLFLYFATRDHSFKIQKVGVASADINGDFSQGAWKQEISQSVLMPEYPFEGECIEAPATIAVNDEIFMFYGGAYNCSPQQIGVAVSNDGVHFDKLSSLPFLPCGEKRSWNEHESGHPYVFADDDGKMYLFYQGTNDNGKTWYLSKKEIRFINDVPEIID